jgi:hypothetical protein
MTRLLMGAAVLAALTAPAAAQSSSRSFYNSNGSFSGSSVTTPSGSSTQGAGTSSFYDRNGHFSGSAIKNSDGTTSFYDGRGHFTGSRSNTTQPK